MRTSAVRGTHVEVTHPVVGTRDRIVAAATELFAQNGYRGASVRDICDRARANSGAVSYHFGGKRQLYRTVLRRAVEAAADTVARATAGQQALGGRARLAMQELLRALQSDPALVRLVVHDLAEGGDVAAETLVPPLRAAYDAARDAIGPADDPRTAHAARALLLDLAAPLLLVVVAWPVLERVFEIPASLRGELLEELLESAFRGRLNDD